MQYGDHKGAHRIFKIAFATFSVIGLIGSLMLFLGANVIANQWLQIPEAEMTLVALSPAIFFVAVSSVMRGYFNGRQIYLGNILIILLVHTDLFNTLKCTQCQYVRLPLILHR